MTFLFHLDKDHSGKGIIKEIVQDYGEDTVTDMLHSYLREYDAEAFYKLINLLNIYNYQQEQLKK